MVSETAPCALARKRKRQKVGSSGRVNDRTEPDVWRLLDMPPVEVQASGRSIFRIRSGRPWRLLQRNIQPPGPGSERSSSRQLKEFCDSVLRQRSMEHNTE